MLSMKKFILFLLIPLLFTGCTHDMSRKEIDEINLILVLGIDYADGEYSLSGLYSTGSGADPEKGAGSGSEEVAEGKGKTAYEALEDLKLKNKKAISLAQTSSFLIGDGAAKEDLKGCLDFLSRDETIKMEALIYIVRDGSASDFINTGIEQKKTVHEDLEAIEQKQQEQLTRNDNTVVNLLNDMEQNYSSILVPYVVSEESGFLIEGYAVFNNLKLHDYLDKETSDGVNFFRNTMRSYPIFLNNEVNLMVSYTNTKLKADLKNRELTVTIRVSFDSMIKEVVTNENIFNQQELQRLTDEQNEYIKDILEKAANYSKTSGLDILNLARLVENQNISEWKNVKEDWPDLIADINYNYKLQSRISKSFILGNKENK